MNDKLHHNSTFCFGQLAVSTSSYKSPSGPSKLCSLNLNTPPTIIKETNSRYCYVYSTYMLVLGSAFPHQLPQPIAYQIVKHSVKFQYPSWQRYNIKLGQWAASNQYNTWSQIHLCICIYCTREGYVPSGALSAIG